MYAYIYIYIYIHTCICVYIYIYINDDNVNNNDKDILTQLNSGGTTCLIAGFQTGSGFRLRTVKVESGEWINGVSNPCHQANLLQISYVPTNIFAPHPISGQTGFSQKGIEFPIFSLICFECARVAAFCDILWHVSICCHILPTFSHESSLGGIHGPSATTPFVPTPSGSRWNTMWWRVLLLNAKIPSQCLANTDPVWSRWNTPC